MNGVDAADLPILLVRRERVVVDDYNHMMDGVDVTDQPILLVRRAMHLLPGVHALRRSEASANMQRGRSRCGLLCPTRGRALSLSAATSIMSGGGILLDLKW